MKRMPWSLYLALWAFGFLLWFSWMWLWSYSPLMVGFGFKKSDTTFWGFLTTLPREWRHLLGPPMEGRLFPDQSFLWENVRTTLLLLLAGAALGFLCRLAPTWGREPMKRLPWGVYLGLWSWGFLLAASTLPLWMQFKHGHFVHGYEHGTGWHAANLWEMLAYTIDDLRSVGFDADYEVLWSNTRKTLIVLAAGAALGVAARWVRSRARNENARNETKKTGGGD